MTSIFHPPRRVVTQFPKYGLHSCRRWVSSQWLSPHGNGSNPPQDRTQEPQNIAVIGGGITGLSTCYYAAKRFPDSQVTLFERSNRLGGVIDSSFIRLDNGQDAICEFGPRTLRANAPRCIAMIDLIQELGLEKELLITRKWDPIASGRYIYYPDHLVRVPVANFSKSTVNIPAPDGLTPYRVWALIRLLATEPVFQGLMAGTVRGLFARKPDGEREDLSIGDLLVRRFGRSVADNIGSAVVQSLFAGDLYKLSARALMPGLWRLDARMPFWSRSGAHMEPWSANEADWLQAIRHGPAGELEKRRFLDASVFSFAKGMGQLSERLTEAILDMSNVSVVKNVEVSAVVKTTKRLCLQYRATDTRTDAETSISFSHIISTTSLPIAMSLLERDLTYLVSDLPTMIHVPVMEVALFYATSKINHPYRGFGYLLPSTLSRDQNPENALGVIFDSDKFPDRDAASGTRICVVLGGHYWPSLPSLPTEEEGAQMAKALLKRHAGITEEPIEIVVRLIPKAIPQYRVGHFDTLKRMHQVLKQYDGRLRVAGNCYHGIGVLDCLYGARRVVETLHETGRTGLECYS